MCGIAGVYAYRSQRPIEPALITRMTASLVHRGPDDVGEHVDGSIGLGMRRLSILDIAGGHQPMSNAAGTLHVVFNGEVYNFRELRSQLSSLGHSFRTRSDTEVVLNAFERWGMDALPRFNGMFGLAIWDARTRRIVLARDPFGIKPLYYWDDQSTLVFGSEVRALLCWPDIPRELETAALDDYLSFGYVPSPLTAFKGIRKLPPGHALECGPMGTRLCRFSKGPPPVIQGIRPEHAVAELQEQLEAAVRRQMVADVPVGAMLSGGVDSTTVATIMTAANGTPIHTFTVGFDAAFAENEIDKARDVARRIGSIHHEAIVSAGEFTSALPNVVEQLEEPIATTSAIAFREICRLARQHVKVVLTGQGADEPFAGYPRYIGEKYGMIYRRVPAAVRNGLVRPVVESLPRNEQLKRAVASLDEADVGERIRRIQTVVSPGLKALLLPDLVDASSRRFVDEVWRRDVAQLDGLAQMLYIDTRTSLADNLLMYGDKMSMSVSLEARVPFLDLELMGFVERLPSRLKLRGRVQKWILKQAVRKWVPPATVNAKKIGFNTPIDQWFRSEMYDELRERLLAAGSACRSHFPYPVVEQIIEEHRVGRHDHKRTLFNLLVFELWYERMIRSNASAPVAPRAGST